MSGPRDFRLGDRWLPWHSGPEAAPRPCGAGEVAAEHAAARPSAVGYECGDVDVWCRVRSSSGASEKFVRIPQVRGSVERLLPKGTIAWCREGDRQWTRVDQTKGAR